MAGDNILFLCLNVFSKTGGVEKVNKIVAKVLSSDYRHETSSILSIHDNPNDLDSRYTNEAFYKAYSGTKLSFSIKAISDGLKISTVLLSHINLLVVGLIIKTIRPSCRLVLFAHGIEIWPALPWWKKRLLKKVDTVISVSNYTRETIIARHGLNEEQVVVLNNCLDPFLSSPTNNGKSQHLLARYGLTSSHIVLLTLSRLSAHDRSKGYEKVFTALKALKPIYPSLVYMIAGKYEAAEKLWCDELINKMGIAGSVIFTGYVPETEMAQHFELADVYIMPSVKEGFGIIFIEAMYYGLPVIAGNKDGSVDAVANGKFGMLVDPLNQLDINSKLEEMLENIDSYKVPHQVLMQQFGYDQYKESLLKILKN